MNTIELLSPEELKENIIEEVPGLSRSILSKDHLSVTTLLREYVYNHIIWSNDGLQIKNYCEGDISRLSVSQISFLFNTKEIGVLCGGVAVYLKKIFELFGYAASTFNYGIPGVSTHVTTLVLIPARGQNELIFQDATFNLTYRIKGTESRNYFELMENILKGMSGSILTEKGKTADRKLYFSANEEGLRHIETYRTTNVLHEDPFELRSDLTNRPMLSASGDLDFHTSYLRRNGDKVLKALSEKLNKDMKDRSVMELMLFPLNMPVVNDERLQAKLNDLEKKLLAFHSERKEKVFHLKEHKINAGTCILPPETEGWERYWHGYYMLNESFTDKGRGTLKNLFSLDYYDAFVLEMFSLLSILEEIDGGHVNFFELGSGRAPWCLTLAGACRFKLIAHPPSSYRVLAVEAEPVHFRWSREHLLKQGINAEVLHGAVTSKVGSCKFAAHTDPASHMGQCVSSDGNIEVPTYTIDFLRERLSFDRIDIVHMDIQGMEVAAVKGADECIRAGLIDYFIIGTHSEVIEIQLRNLLGSKYDLLVELPICSTVRMPGIEKPFRSSGDGIQVYRRKGIYH